MTLARARRLMTLTAIAALVATGAPGALAADPAPASGDVGPAARPARTGLSSSALRAAVVAVQGGRDPGPGIHVDRGRISVEVHPAGGIGPVRGVVEQRGGTVTGEIPGLLVEALVPVGQIAALEADDRVAFVTPATRVNVPTGAVPPAPALEPVAQAVLGGEVARTNASIWQAAGFDGAGVRVGIIDSFHSTTWNNARTAGEVPAAAGLFCRDYGKTCSTLSPSGSQHGVAVAEAIHEMAPGASLYLATANTLADLQAAVDWFAANGVDIISRSETSQFDGAGDGSGYIAGIIESAVARGQAWFQSAGNNGGPSPLLAGYGNVGSYWRGTWKDADVDGWLEWSGSDEIIAFDGCSYMNGLRWSDFNETRMSDYDLYIWNKEADVAGGSATAWQKSENFQPIQPPIERVAYACDPSDPVDYAAVKGWSYVGTEVTAGDEILEFAINGGGIEYWQNAYSASLPAVDSASPGMMAVGAIATVNGTTIAAYSSRGPTNDGRIKPDIAAPANYQTYAYGGAFGGTSAATPVAAGAAAILMDWGATTPECVVAYLARNAVDSGAAGPDSTYGAGRLRLPGSVPAAPSPTFDIFSGDSTAYGTAAPCRPVTVKHLDSAGSVLDQVTTLSGADGEWAADFGTDSRIVAGTKVSATAAAKTRTITMPTLTLRTDRATDVVSGKAPAGKTITVEARTWSGLQLEGWRAGAPGATAPVRTSRTVTVPTGGSWSTDFTDGSAKPQRNFNGGDEVAVTYVSGSDVFRASEYVQRVKVRVGSSAIRVDSNTGQTTRFELWTSANTTMRGQASVSAGYVTAGLTGDFTAIAPDGSRLDYVAVRSGDRVKVPAATWFSDIKNGVSVPSVTLSVTASSDVVSGTCPASRPYSILVSGAFVDTWRFGTASATGAVSWDATSTVDIRSGDRVELGCKLSTGDVVSRVRTTP